MNESDLSCWYLHLPRIAQLTGLAHLGEVVSKMESISRIDSEPIQAALQISIFKDALRAWMRENPLPPFELLLQHGQATPGRHFYIYRDFYGRGLKTFHKENPPGSFQSAEIYAKFKLVEPSVTLRVPYHPEHFCSHTAWSKLSGHTRLYIVGYIDHSTETEVVAHPYVLADPVEPTRALISHWANRREVYIEQIDNFTKVKAEPRPAEGELKVLRSIPETDIKAAFAEILAEPDIPLDWGGERSDLYTTQVRIDGQRISAAFAFKGPAGGSAFRPMTFAQLGKNGDQIERLFSEPADLLVLQHCHNITTPIRTMMRAFACQLMYPRLCCVIDGYDTLRVLRAYEKCGQSPTISVDITKT